MNPLHIDPDLSTSPAGATRPGVVGTVGVVGSGVVGRRVERRLRLLGHRSVAISSGQADQYPTLVLAHPGPHARLVEQLLTTRRTIVTVADALDDVRELLTLGVRASQVGARVVVGAGMSPGLSGLVARFLAGSFAHCDEIHIAVHGTAGPACARQHHRALAGRALGWSDGRWVTARAGTGRELCWFPEPVGAYDCYRAEIPGSLPLSSVFPQVQRISTRMSANRRDRLTSRLPMLAPPHPEGGVGALRVEVRGRTSTGAQVTRICGIAEQVGTAAASTAVAFADAAINDALPTGMVVAGDERIDTLALLHQITRLGVRLQDFTGEAS